MQPEFWHKRWTSNQIGFHLPEVNPYLQRYWPQLGLEEGSRVLVPLCGKSLDLLWLGKCGHEVLGVELSEKAVEDFFHEHQFDPDVSDQGPFTVYRAGSIEIWCGDFFALPRSAVVVWRSVVSGSSSIPRCYRMITSLIGSTPSPAGYP